MIFQGHKSKPARDLEVKKWLLLTVENIVVNVFLHGRHWGLIRLQICGLKNDHNDQLNKRVTVVLTEWTERGISCFRSHEINQSRHWKGRWDEGRDLTKSLGQHCTGRTLEALCDESRAQHLTERETDDLLQIKEQQTHCSLIFLPLFSHPIYPPQRIIDAIHAPEMLRRCDFLLLLLLCFSALFFSPNPKRSRGTGGSPLKFFFPLRLSVTDWQKEHMTGVQMADKNKIRHVMRY